jgi:hypothetical protein
MRLLAKAFLWLHVTLYRLTNGRIGGRFVAGSPILLLTTTGRRTGKRRTRPLWPMSATTTAMCCAPPTAAPPPIPAGTTIYLPPAGQRSGSHNDHSLARQPLPCPAEHLPAILR